MNCNHKNTTKLFTAIGLLMIGANAFGAVTVSQISTDYFHYATNFSMSPFAGFSNGTVSNDYSVQIERKEERFIGDSFVGEAISLITIDVDYRADNDLQALMLGQYVKAQNVTALQYYNHLWLNSGDTNSKMYVYCEPIFASGTGLTVGLEVSRFVPPNSYQGGSVGLTYALYEFDLLANNTYRITHTATTDTAPPIYGSALNKVLITFGEVPTSEQIQAFNSFVAVPEPSSVLIASLGFIGCLTRRRS